MWASQLFIILAYLLQIIGVEIVSLLLSRGGPLIIDDKVDREKGTFKPNIDVRSSIN